MSEIYTLEQLRKMNQLDGNKKLIFVDQIQKGINEVCKETKTKLIGTMIEIELGIRE